MLSSIPLDGFQTPNPEVLGEAVNLHGIYGPVGPILAFLDNRHEG